MSDPVKRAERWKAKYNVERVKDTLNDIREDMGKRYEAAIAEVCAMEGKVKEVINTAGVSTALYTTNVQQRRFRDDVSDSRLCPEVVGFVSIAVFGTL